jgi:hypothetical protein
MVRSESPANRLFGSAGVNRLWSPARVWRDAPLEQFLSITGSTLQVAPFLLHKWGQHYHNPEAICIAFEQLPADLYRIVAVHNFRIEDCNPNLDECLAGIFLARRVGVRWEEAEDHPVECRSIEVLGYLDTSALRVTPP